MIGQQSPPTPPTDAGRWDQRRRVWVVCLVLAAITFAVFGQTLTHEFVSLDDSEYVYANPMVVQGLTIQGIVWAFAGVHAENWHPLTWLSHMLDCQLYGLNPAGHHLSNVLLHTATVILLFLVLHQMTGALWRSAFVAAVFAIHPLRVESVAWVAERKDVLSGLFFILTIGSYVRYARLPPSLARYALVLLLFVLGLMCKPMLVTLPVVLLLLDYWPLQRTESAGKLILEKLPLLALSAASCVTTVVAQHRALQTMESFSLPLRFANALVTCMIYLAQMVWPARLAALYPYPYNGLPLWEVVLAGILLVGLSVVAVWQRRTRPWLLIGWTWYLVMLLPVMGLIQVGRQAHADRYTYLPQIGIYLAVTWWAAEWRIKRAVRRVLMAAVLVVLMVCAGIQATYWQDTKSLWTHALACNANNADAQSNLGLFLMQQGDVDEAIPHFQKALEIDPGHAEAQNNFGNALRQKGRVDEAIAHYQKALQITPDTASIHFNLANALLQKGRAGEAIVQFQESLKIEPADPRVQNSLAWLLATCPQAPLRNGARAVELARQANASNGGENPDVLHTLAAAYAEAGRFSEAVDTARHALELAGAQSNTELAGRLQLELKLYQANRPYHVPEQTH
jgi:protein O-mannosyl-transferase